MKKMKQMIKCIKTRKNKSFRNKIAMFSKSIKKRKDAIKILKKFVVKCCLIGNKSEQIEDSKERDRSLQR